MWFTLAEKQSWKSLKARMGDSSGGINQTIRVAYQVQPPYVRNCSNLLTCERPGVDAKLLLRVLAGLGYHNLSFQSVQSTQEQLALIDSGLADVSANTLGTLLRFDFPRTHQLPPVADETARFLIKAAVASPLTSKLLFGATDPLIWAVFFLAFVFIIAVRRLSKCFSRPHFGRRIFGVAQLAWWLMLAVAFGVYSSFLSIQFNKPLPAYQPFQTYSQLASRLLRRQCRVVVSEAADLEEPLMKETLDPDWRSNRPAALLMRQAFRRNPPLVAGSVDAMVSRILAAPSEPCLVGVVYKSGAQLLGSRFCALRVVELPSVPQMSYAFFARRNATFIGSLSEVLNRVGAELYERGERVLKIAAEKSHVCPEDVALLSAGKKSLQIAQLMDLFWLSIAITSAAILFFLAELLSPAPFPLLPPTPQSLIYPYQPTLCACK